MTNFTPEQEKAIHAQGKDTLVSASAGAGKTTVLVQRVIDKILSGIGVDQLLVITFTKAAAEEMKTRIKKLLQEKLQVEPHNRFMQLQLLNIDTDNISTIDAFCLDVVRRFYYVVNLDPSFSILTDATQSLLLKERALKEIERQKIEAKDADFIALYDNFSGDRDVDAPRQLLLALYDQAMTKPDYAQWLHHLADIYHVTDQNLVMSKIWQAQIKPNLLKQFNALSGTLTQLLSTSYFDNTGWLKIRENFQTFSSRLKTYTELLAADSDYNAQRQALHNCLFEMNTRKNSKWDEDTLSFYETTQTVKKNAKAVVMSTFVSFYATESSKQLAAMQKGQKLSQSIAETELALIDRFSALKREQNLLDYSDMEQFAYQILSQQTSASQLARDFYQQKFNEILVDEYQDINGLQEKIIQKMKKEGRNTLFLVGDVKQSIYGFRQAEPTLFLKKYHDYQQNPDEQLIILADNFRSTKPVTSFVNTIFDSLLTKDFGGIDYRHESQLKFKATYFPDDIPKATEVIYSQNQKKETETEDLEDSRTDELDFSQIQMVIARIQQMKKAHFKIFEPKSQSLRDLTYSDIAILTRSRTNNLEIMREFSKHKLPLFIVDAENYFQTFELTVIMAYLQIIDNPDQDIPLVTTLRSPLFNFNEPELAQIRIKTQNTSFYEALASYALVASKLGHKVKAFLNRLEDLRQFSKIHRISELIWSIYEQTDLLKIVTAMPNGEQRRINLESLYERAASYESAGFKGLYQFVAFIKRMRESKKDLAQPLLSKEAGNAVKLMTIHGAKGLEFPVVFYVGLGHRFQLRDLSNDFILTSEQLGLTIKQPDYRLDTLVKAMSNFEKRKQLLQEEARIIYVALTRAKQKLILVADIKGLDRKKAIWAKSLSSQGTLPLYAALQAASPLDLMGPQLAFDDYVDQKMSAISNAIDSSSEILHIAYDQSQVLLTKPLKATEKEAFQTSERMLQKVNALYNFKYPFEDATKTTAYQAVSEIKKAFNDPDEKELENSRLLKSTNRYLQPIETKPNFLYQHDFTGAEVGTATHLILQYYDYTHPGNEENLKAEIASLISEEKLNPEIVPHLNLNQIQWFVNSDFAAPFRQKPQALEREASFSSLLSAQTLFDHFSDPSAKILIHGTIDGYYLTENGIILFDYKTDYVDPSNQKEAILAIKQKYTRQLRLYEQALNEFAPQKVAHKFLILLSAKKWIEVV